MLISFMETVIKLSFVVVAYLLGSIPAGLLISRLRGVDIRSVGSGNIGATNVFRSVGKGWGSLTFLFDALKGFIPAYGFPLLFARPDMAEPGEALALAFGCAAIAGHNWPVFLRFKGGKGVATSAGVLLGIVPSAFLIGLATWILLLGLTGYVAVASMGAAVAISCAGWLLYQSHGPLLPITLTALGLVVIYTHRSNIQRLMNGTEHRFRRKN